jgi:hypothetical protein
MEPLLLLWCRGGEEMAESIPKGGGISWIGDSNAEGGAVTGRLYFGVRGSLLWMKDGSIPSMGKVWLLGRWKLLPGGGNRACCEGNHDPELLSGEKAKGVVGLVGPPENEEGAVSVKALDKDVVLWEFECLYPPPWPNSKYPFRLSDLRSSSLLVADNGEGEGKPLGEVGEIPLGVCDADPPAESGLSEPLSEMLVSEALRVSLAPPMPFFCLNFSSQLVLFVFRWLSLLPTVVAKNLAFSLIAASVKGWPCFCMFLTQFERALSISGNFPLARFTGERLRSSGKRYFSLWRRTLETVLET